MNRVAAKMELRFALDSSKPQDKTTIVICLTHVRRLQDGEPEHWRLHATMKNRQDDKEIFETKDFGKFITQSDGEKAFMKEIVRLVDFM